MRGSLYSGGDFPFQIAGNRTWTGFQTFLGAANQSNPTAEFKAASGQTGNLLEFYNAAGTRVAYFDQAGNFTTTGASTQFASTAVVQGSDTAIGFQVKRASGTATADLQQWQDQNGNVLLRVTAAGNLQSGSGAFSVNALGVGVTSPVAPLQVATAATATANYGTASIGAGPFDGTSAGHFVGSTGGTILASNAASGFAGDLANFQVAGASLWKLDAAGNTTQSGKVTAGNLSLPSSGALLDFQGTLTNTPQAGSLSGYRIRLYGANNNYNDYGIGIAASEFWANAASGGHFSFYTGGTQAALLQSPGTTERSSSGNLLLKRSAATQAQGVTLSNGVAYDAAILRTANDDALRVGFDTGGAFTERLILQTNGCLTIDPSGSNATTLPSQGAALNFGSGTSGEGISSRRTAGSNQYGLDVWTNNTVRMSVSAAGIISLGGGAGGGTLSIRPDASTTNPSTGAWMRSDGAGGLVINPSSAGNLYLCYDQKNTVVVSGAFQVSGVSTFTAAAQFDSTLAINGLGDFGTSNAGALTVNSFFSNGGIQVANTATFNGTAVFNNATGINIAANGGLTFTNQTTFNSGVTDASKAIRVYVNGSPFYLKLYQ